MIARVKNIFYLLFAVILFAGNQVVAKADPSAHFLVVTDIHFDPFRICTTTPCQLIDTLRQSDPNQWEAILQQYDNQPAAYGKDSNYPLLKSALEESSKQATAENAQFVLVLGDLLGHNYNKNFSKYSSDPSQYVLFVQKTMKFLSIELGHSFPNIDVYTVLGNNDSDVGDYYQDVNGHFLQYMADDFLALIKSPIKDKPTVQRAFEAGGFYAVTIPQQTNLRLIVLNSILFSNKAKGPNIDPAAQAELDWLEKELNLARRSKQKVFIALHIPAGIDVFSSLGNKPYKTVEFWQPQYTARFETELQRYSPEILGILAGHMHLDSFQVLTFSRQQIPVSVVPAISPQFGNNPAFKIFSYDGTFGREQLLDFETYFYPISNASPKWAEEYNFNSVYQPNCPNCNIISGMRQLGQTGPLASDYQNFFAVGHDSQPITQGAWLPYYWCAITKVLAVDYNNCVA